MNLLVKYFFIKTSHLLFCLSSACQIDSQQTNLIDDTNMDIGELSLTEQRLFGIM
jgi:hypothetical protein